MCSFVLDDSVHGMRAHRKSKPISIAERSLTHRLRLRFCRHVCNAQINDEILEELIAPLHGAHDIDKIDLKLAQALLDKRFPRKK